LLYFTFDEVAQRNSDAIHNEMIAIRSRLFLVLFKISIFSHIDAR